MPSPSGRGQDRRGAVRYPVEFPVEIFSGDGKPLAGGRMADLSTGGARIRTSAFLPIGQKCRLLFALDEKTGIQAEGEVAYRADPAPDAKPPSSPSAPAPFPEISVRFTRIASMDRDRIRLFFSRRKRKSYDDIPYRT